MKWKNLTSDIMSVIGNVGVITILVTYSATSLILTISGTTPGYNLNFAASDCLYNSRGIRHALAYTTMGYGLNTITH